MRLSHTETTEKHGEISGNLVSDEFLDSSRSVLKKARGGKGTTLTGGQQWFTPGSISRFAARVCGSSLPTLDFTAGNGGMLQGFAEETRFGIEIDGDQIDRSNYESIKGDAQDVVPMLRAAGARFNNIAINPPFGLSWTDPVHTSSAGTTNSTTLAFKWALDLMASTGQGVMLCGRDRFAKHLAHKPEAKGVYAIVEFGSEQVWKGVTLPTVLVFFVKPQNIRRGIDQVDTLRLERTVDDLDHATVRQIQAKRDEVSNYITTRSYPEMAEELMGQWKAVRTENKRLVDNKAKLKKGKKPDNFDLSLKGNKLSALPSPYKRILLAKKGLLRSIELLQGQPVNYFASNQRDWDVAIEAERDGLLSVSDALKDRIAQVMDDAEKTATPLFPVKPHMRLGWLTEIHKIHCIKSDPARGFIEGETYPIKTGSQLHTQEEYKVIENRQGEPERRKVIKERKLLHVAIKGNEGTQEFNESPESTDYLINHFEIPDPGCVKTRFPELYKKMSDLLKEIEADYGFTLKFFQRDHLARLLTKGRGLLAHEQGLGKTLMLMTLIEAQVRLGAKNKALIITPQDLIPQWGREAKKFFGKERLDIKNARDLATKVFGKTIAEIRTPADAIKAARFLENGGEGWFITYFEALSVVGKKMEPLEPVLLNRASEADPIRTTLRAKLPGFRQMKAEKKANSVDWRVGAIQPTVPDEKKKPKKETDPYTGEDLTEEAATSRWACPRCGADTAHAWTGEVCRKHPEKGLLGCGYVHRRYRKKPAYAYLTKCFIDGVVAVDELSEIRGDQSLRSRAVRALARGDHKYGGTGTPLSNYINDAFWGLWFCLGNASVAFPYDYEGGKAKFEQDFAVVEHLMKKDEEHNKQRTKVMPEVTNVSQFWKLTQPHVSRCRKEQTGEPLVERIFHPIHVPLGQAQKKMHDFWLKNFADYFTWAKPDHELVKLGLVDRFAAALGQGWRLEFAATMPDSDEPTKTWPIEQWPTKYRGGQPCTGHDAYPWVEDLSNYTPANLKVLELALKHVEKGEKVLIGSDIIPTGNWLHEQLTKKGVYSVHLTEEDGQGKVTTKNPRKRAKEVAEFAEGRAQVMCAGTKAMKLGHNLDVASTVIVHGLPYSHMEMDQFLARVHRLTSKKPVNVYVIIPEGTIAERKWQLLKDKEGASDLAFDGQLSEQQEEVQNLQQIVREMQQAGIKSDGDEIDEASIKEQFAKLRFTPPKVAAPSVAKPKPVDVPDEGYKPPEKLPAQAAREHRTAERKKAKKPKKKDTGMDALFSFGEGEKIVYEQVSLF